MAHYKTYGRNRAPSSLKLEGTAWKETKLDCFEHNDIFYLKCAILGLFSFFVLANKHYNSYNKQMWKNVHPVYSTGIRSHDLWNMSLLL